MYGPHIDFDSKFEYLGEDLLFIFYYNSSQNIDMNISSYLCVNEFVNLGKNIVYTLDDNYIPNEKYLSSIKDIRLELER